ncbi:hypothetical protein GTA08_BOTSDO09389 [Neofusicoccum parvum]|uniref:Uncharacterized protein n=1 Tax=Neofusicoccum parvum TaxID=310453 RepID=A0ACB5S313_9PEZI|nr:hypothetical protein GTA08_BOTSDO09389 [Neofusicoccum parvum]
MARTRSAYEVTTKTTTFRMSPNGIMTETNAHQKSSQRENQQIQVTPLNKKSKTARICSKLRKFPKSTGKVIRSASTKVVQACSKSFKGKSRLAGSCASLLCNPSISRENEPLTPSTTAEPTPSSHVVLSVMPEASTVYSDNPANAVPENSIINTASCGDNTSSSSSNNNTVISGGSVEFLDRSSDDPGHTPSPYYGRATTMEVCAWTMSPEIAGDIAWIREEAAAGNVQMGIPRIASCLNRAINNHLYDLPHGTEIRLPAGATGGKDHYLMDGPKRLYPRGAMGLRSPLNPGFSTWRRTPEGMILVHRDSPHHWHSIPESSRLRNVETVSYDEERNALAAPCVTGRTLRRHKAMVSRQLGQQTIPEELNEGRAGLKPILEEDGDEFEALQKPDIPDQLAPLSSEDSDSTAGSSDNWQDLKSDSDSGGKESSEALNDTTIRIMPIPYTVTKRFPLPRPAGCYNPNPICEDIIEEEEDELRGKEGSYSELHPGFRPRNSSSGNLASGHDSEERASLNSFEIDWEAACKLASLHGNSNSLDSNDQSEPESVHIVQYEHVKPAPVQFEEYDSDENDGRVFPWQRGVSKIIWQHRPQAAADKTQGRFGSKEEEEDIWAQQGAEEESIASSGLSPLRGANISNFDFSSGNSKGPATSSAHSSEFSAFSQDEIAIGSFNGDNESECDGDAFSIKSSELENTDTELPNIVPFQEESTVVHNSSYFRLFNPLNDQPIRLRPQTREQLSDIMTSIEDNFDHDDIQILLPCSRPDLPIGVKYAEEQVASMDEGPHLIIPEEDASMHFVVADSPDEEDDMDVDSVQPVEPYQALLGTGTENNSNTSDYEDDEFGVFHDQDFAPIRLHPNSIEQLAALFEAIEDSLDHNLSEPLETPCYRPVLPDGYRYVVPDYAVEFALAKPQLIVREDPGYFTEDGEE